VQLVTSYYKKGHELGRLFGCRSESSLFSLSNLHPCRRSYESSVMETMQGAGQYSGSESIMETPRFMFLMFAALRRLQ
jgi:hypothetical protein